MEPGKAQKTSDKWLDSPVSLPGLREKFGISSGVIWGIVLSTQKGIQIFCTLEKYKKAPLSLSKRGAPQKGAMLQAALQNLEYLLLFKAILSL